MRNDRGDDSRRELFAARTRAVFLAIALVMIIPASGRVASARDAGNLLQFRSAGHVLGFDESGMYLASRDHMLRVEMVKGRAVSPVAADEAGGAGSNEATPGLTPTLTRVSYPGEWDGVTVSYQSQPGAIVKSTYRIDAGAKGKPVDRIRLRYNRPATLERGNLVLSYGTGQMVQQAPVAWQEIEGRQHPVTIAYSLEEAGEEAGDAGEGVAEETGEEAGDVGFAVGDYDPEAPLLIDCSISWNTFLGGLSGGIDYGTAIAVDGSGSVYVGGRSDASWGTPVRAYTGSDDAFAAKLDNNGNLTWNTFLGGAGTDYGNAIAVDGNGSVYVGGVSAASWGTPVRAYTADYDAFAAKLDNNGNLTWNTFLGGAGYDLGYAIAVDGSGSVYVGGRSTASWGTPVRVYTGGDDAFAAKLDTNGNLTWNTFLGGAGTDYGNAIAVDGSGSVYVGGVSTASWGTPVRVYTGGGDAFAAKLDNNGNLTWNTFLGGAGFDSGYAIAVDGSGSVYVGGYSSASWGTPVRVYTGGNDAFVAKLDNNGNLTWNTFLGGAGNDYSWAIAVDGSGSVYVGGYSSASWGTPVRAYTAGYDAFAAKLDNNGNLTWNTFLGGAGTDVGYAIAVDGSGSVYVGGYSGVTWGTPVRAYTAGYDAFAAKLDTNGNLTWNTFLGGGAGDDSGCYAIAVDGSGSVYVGGYSSASWGTPVRAYTAGYDAFAAKLDTNGNLTWNTFLGGAGIDYGRAIAVDGSGRVYVGGYSTASWGTPVRAYTAGYDAFAAKLDNNGNLTWNTFLGGAGTDYGYAIAVDGSGSVYVGGYSTASWGTPVRAYTAGYDAFAAKLDNNGNLTWNTFLGGAGDDYGSYAIAVDGSGSVYVGGYSGASWGTPVRAYTTGGYDAFAAKLDTNGNLTWNTFLGGAGEDIGYAIAVDGSGSVYVGGSSGSPWGSPVRGFTGGTDAFAAKVTILSDASAQSFDIPPNGGAQMIGATFSPQATFGNTGSFTVTNLPVRYRIVGPAPSTTEIYNQATTIPSLNCGVSSQVTFPSLSIVTGGVYTMYAASELVGDGAPANNEISGTLHINNIVGAVLLPLLVRKNAITPPNLDLSWGPSCGGAATDYAVYEGTIGSFYSHTSIPGCTSGGTTSSTNLVPGSGNRYYLVVPLSPTDEGSYGTDSSGAQIPQGTSPCRATQEVLACQ